MQEHTVQFITRLLSPPAPVDYDGVESHLIGYAPMLNVLIVGIIPVDCVQIFSLHGLVHFTFTYLKVCHYMHKEQHELDLNISSFSTSILRREMLLYFFFLISCVIFEGFV